MKAICLPRGLLLGFLFFETGLLLELGILESPRSPGGGRFDSGLADSLHCQNPMVEFVASSQVT